MMIYIRIHYTALHYTIHTNTHTHTNIHTQYNHANTTLQYTTLHTHSEALQIREAREGSIHIHIHIYLSISISISTYIYIYLARPRKKGWHGRGARGSTQYNHLLDEALHLVLVEEGVLPLALLPLALA